MKRIGIRMLSALFGLSAFAGCNLMDAPSSFSIVKDGKPKAVIVPANDKAAESAARKLQKHIKKITGAELKIEKSKYKGQGGKIFISTGKTVSGFELPVNKLKNHGFALKTEDGNLAIVGKDAPGTEYAINYFLQKYCGVRWFFPGELGTVVPAGKDIEIPKLNEFQNPDFLLRNVGPRKSRKWRKHNYVGASIKFTGGHSFLKHVPPEKFWKSNPEYYAQINGKRKKPAYMDNPKKRKWCGWQLCTSNPEVIDKVALSVCNTFKEKPDLDAVGISPNDGYGWCECEKCRALDTEKESISERIFTFANAVAEKVAKKHPDKYVVMFAYAKYLKAPKLKLKPNIIVWFTYSAANLYADSNGEVVANLKKWSRKAEHIWIYEYYVAECWTHFTPRIIIDNIGWEIPFFYKHGIEGYVSQSGQDWAMNGPHYYLAAQLLWNSTLDSKKVMNEYCEMLFGKAALAMKRYFETMQNAWNNGLRASGKKTWFGDFPDNEALRLYNDGVLYKCRESFDKAERLAENDEKSLKRIKMFRAALTFTENHVAILKSFKKLAESGITVSYHFKLGDKIQPPHMIKKNLKEAEKSIEKQLAFIKSEKNSNAIGYGWLRNPGDNPGRYMPRMEKKLELVERYLRSYSKRNDRVAYRLPSEWEFRLDKSNQGIKEKWFSKKWLNCESGQLRVPAFWNKTKKYKNYGGVAWYRVSFEIPRTMMGQGVFASFGAIDAEADVYVNGQLAGRHPYKPGSWKEPFEFDLSRFVVTGQNVLTVRVDGHGRNSGIWQPVSVFTPVDNFNMLINSSFGNGLNCWSWGPYRDKKGRVAKPIIIDEPRRDGKSKCVMRDTQGQLTQRVAVKVGSKYKLSGWIKAEKLRAKSYVDLYIAPKCICRAGILRNDSDWTFFEKTFTAKAPMAIVTLRLMEQGKAYFDDIKLIEIKEDKK